MGNAHAEGYARASAVWPESRIIPRLVHVADASPDTARTTAARWGFARWTTDWRQLIDDPEVDVVDVSTPNDQHLEIVLAAIASGKHVACEKPLGRSVEEARAMADAARSAGVVSQAGFNYRLTPAVQYARDLVRSGRLGDISHFRGVFLTDFGRDPDTPLTWRYDRRHAGDGALTDLGSHVVQLAEWLVGPISAVVGSSRTIVTTRPVLRTGTRASHFSSQADAAELRDKVTNDDHFVALVRFQSGALGTMESSRVAAGPKARLAFGLNGSGGSVEWDLERSNELSVQIVGEPPDLDGYRRVLSSPTQPDFGRFSPGPGVNLGWQETKVIEAYRLLRAVAGVEATDADFDAAARVATVIEGIRASQARGEWVEVGDSRPSAMPRATASS